MQIKAHEAHTARLSFALTLLMFFLSSPLLAQECDPSKFLIENTNLETLDLVTAGQLITSNSESWNDGRRKSITSAFSSGGDAGSLLFDSAKSRARAVLTTLNYTYSNSERRVLFSSSLSPAGADAYEKCLSALQNSLVLEVPSSAISSKQFPIKIKWKVVTPEKGRYQLKVSSANAVIDDSVRDFGPNEQTAFLVRARDRTQNTSIIARVVRKNRDGSSSEVQSEIVHIPPNLQITQRFSPQTATVEAAQPNGRVNYDGISEHCFITSRPDSILVEKSASFNRIESRNAWDASFPTQSPDRVCIRLSASPKNDSPAFVKGIFFVNELFYDRTLTP